MSVLEQDTFIRANQSGWGTASNGDTYTTRIGSPTLAISSNEGTITGITAQVLLQLGSTTSADGEVLVRCSASASTSNRMGVSLRISTNNGYIARLSAAGNNLVIGKIVSGTETDLFTATFTVTASTFYWIRYRVVGTAHFAKAWADGSAEPASWNINGSTDSTFTSAGGFGITANSTSSGTTMSFDSLLAVDYPFQDILATSDASSSTVVGLNTDSLTESEVTAATLNQNNVTYKTVATDTFNRANQSGWGTASDGTTWSGGTLTYAISSNTGTITGTAGNNYTNVLDAEISTVESGFVTFQVTNTNNLKVGILLRWVDANNHYFCYADFNSQNITIAKNVAGAFTSLTSIGVTITSATNYDIEFRVIGSSLFCKFWQDGSAIPTTWTLSTTDSTFANAGKVGIFANSNNNGTITVDNFFVNSYPNGDFLTLTEVNNPTVIDLNTDSLTTTDTNAETVTFLPVDTLTTTEINAATVANTITDTLTLVDTTKATVINTVTDTLTSVEVFLNTVTGGFTEVSNLSEVLATALSLATSDSLTSTDSISSISFVLVQLVDITLNLTEIFAATVTGLSTDHTTNTESAVYIVAVAFTDTLIFANMILTNVYLTDVALTATDTSTQLLNTTVIDQSVFTDNLIFALSTLFQAVDTLTLVESYVNTINTFDTTNTVPLDISTTAVTYTPTADAVGALSDSIVQAFTWILGDTNTVSDALAETIIMLQTDTSTVLDQYAAKVSSVFLDILSTIDTSVTTIIPLNIDILISTDAISEKLIYTVTDTITITEQTNIILQNTITDTMALSELIAYTLAAIEQEHVGVNELFLALISTTTLDTSTLQETTLMTGMSQITDQLVEQDLLAVGLTTGLSDQNNVLDVVKVSLTGIFTDQSSVLETLLAILSTGFTGWTDILTIQDSSTATVINLVTDTSALSEQLSYSILFVPIDQLVSTNILTGLISTTTQDLLQLVDVSTTALSSAVAESLISSESVLWTSIVGGVDTILTVSEIASYSLLNTITDQSTILDQLTISLSFVGSTDALTLIETIALRLTASPIDVTPVQEGVTFALVWVTIDTALTVNDILTGIGYSLVDIPLMVIDAITFTQTIYRLAYARIRSGQANTPVRVGLTVIQ